MTKMRNELKFKFRILAHFRHFEFKKEKDMLKRISWIAVLMLIPLTLWAQESVYRVVGINDPQLYDQIDYARDYKSISPQVFEDLSKPLQPGDVVSINSPEMAVKMRTPAGNSVWFSGKQAFKLPQPNGVWWNLKDALFDVTNLTVVEFNEYVVQAQAGRFNITEYEDNSVMLQVYEGAASIRVKGGAQVDVPSRFWLLATPGQPFPTPQSLDGSVTKTPAKRSNSGDVKVLHPQSKSSEKPIVVKPAYSAKPAKTVELTPQQTDESPQIATTGFVTTRPQPPMPAAQTEQVEQRQATYLPPSINPGGSGFLSKMFSSKWFYIGTGLVASSAVGVSLANTSSTDPPSTLADLPGPPNPGGN